MTKCNLFRVITLLIVITFVGLGVSSCMSHTHTVGNGASTGSVVKGRQWYALWGLVKIGTKDTKTMVHDATDYKVETYYGFVDYIINYFLGIFSIQSRTIKVTY